MSRLSIGQAPRPNEKRIVFIGTVAAAPPPPSSVQAVLATQLGVLMYSAPSNTASVLPGIMKAK